MNDTNEPRRLVEGDDAPAGLRALLQQAHDDVPPSATIALLVRAAEVRAASPKPGFRRPWARRALLAAAIVGAGAGTWYWAAGHSANRPPLPESPAMFAKPPTSPAPAPSATATPAETATPPAVTTEVVTGPPSARAHKAKVGKSGHALSGTAPSETETAASTSAGLEASGEEYRLLRVARQALSADPASALRLTDEHARRFAHGMLVQEREAIAVAALARLGREREANARAQAFYTAYPSSPYRSRVEAALAQTPTGRHP